MRDGVLLRHFVCLQRRDGEPQLGTALRVRNQGFVMVGTFLQKNSIEPDHVDCVMVSIILECSCSSHVCDSQCKGERRLRALHVYRLHRQPTPVRQCPSAVHWLEKLL